MIYLLSALLQRYGEARNARAGSLEMCWQLDKPDRPTDWQMSRPIKPHPWMSNQPIASVTSMADVDSTGTETMNEGGQGLVGNSGGYYQVVEDWRSKLGLPRLALDAKLEANAIDTSVSSNGRLVHKLNPDSMAQVMAPGKATDFEDVFVGGWLCEIPTMPGLGSVCATKSLGWTYGGQTEHAKILSDRRYTRIGCGFGKGIWTCDLA